MRDPREWRERFDRDSRRFDRLFRWVFPFALVLGLLITLAWVAILIGGATWLWSLYR